MLLQDIYNVYLLFCVFHHCARSIISVSMYMLFCLQSPRFHVVATLLHCIMGRQRTPRKIRQILKYWQTTIVYLCYPLVNIQKAIEHCHLSLNYP